MLVLDMGCLEEFGGWFTSLNIQYLGMTDIGMT